MSCDECKNTMCNTIGYYCRCHCHQVIDKVIIDRDSSKNRIKKVEVKK